MPDGSVTPGIFDHRTLVPHYGIPTDLKGKRVLDVATFDGFWAFEFERRGADVTALDIGRISHCDMPSDLRRSFLSEGLDRDTGEGFHLAHEALRSNVKRVECSVYDLNPSVLGTFDFVHAGDLLLHLENPISALRAIRSVTEGRALISDCVDPALGPGLTTYHGGWSSLVWWMPSLDTLGQMIRDVGFSDVSVQAFYSLGSANAINTVWRASLLATP
ncbi:MAG TPA: methyltransferase domain-containing protein [Acidimicrobiales bacterium]